MKAAFGGSAKQTADVLCLSPGEQGTYNKQNIAESPILGHPSHMHCHHHSCCKAAEQELTNHLCFVLCALALDLQQSCKMEEKSVASLIVPTGRFSFFCSS